MAQRSTLSLTGCCCYTCRWVLVTELLELDPIKRLGSRVRGRRGVREHPFFAVHLDVDQLEQRKLKAPWVPTIEGKGDLRNFDDYGNDEQVCKEQSKASTQSTTYTSRVLRTATRMSSKQMRFLTQIIPVQYPQTASSLAQGSDSGLGLWAQAMCSGYGLGV